MERIKALQADRLIADHSGGGFHRTRIESSKAEIATGPGNEEGRSSMNEVKANKVQISPIEDVNGSRLERQPVQDVDIVAAGRGDKDRLRKVAFQVEQGMNLDGCFVMTKSGPGEQTQAELDDGRIQSVSSLLQFDSERFLGIERLGLLDE